MMTVLPYIQSEETASVFLLLLGLQLNQRQTKLLNRVLRRKAFRNSPIGRRVRIKVGLEGTVIREAVSDVIQQEWLDWSGDAQKSFGN